MRSAVLLRIGILVATLSLGTLIWHVALADEPTSAQDGQIAAITTRQSGAQEAVKIVGDSLTTLTSSTTDTVLASTAITVPAGHIDLAIVEFAGESACFYTGAPVGDGTGTCQLHMRVGNTALIPVAGIQSFDSTDSNNETSQSYEFHAMTRFICLNGGTSGKTFRVFVDISVTDTPMTFSIDDWTLKIERSHGC